jgi:predicted AlkP superfamily pyrophosphatase or phosphodiesterase
MRTHRFSSLFQSFAVLVLAGLWTVAAASQAAKPHSPKVVVISLDAFAAESLHDPHLPIPTLRALMKNGAYARSMQPINPTVTWPNHTAMVTGMDASRHHLLVNGLIVGQRTDHSPAVIPGASKTELVAVPTVYDAAHAAGLTTAEVDWVAVSGADAITWSFAEHPDPSAIIPQEMILNGEISREDLVNFGRPSQAWRDRMYTQAAVDILRKHHPDLLLMHLLTLDSIEHGTGFGNDSGRNTIAFLDDRVKDIVDAVREDGDLDNTTFLIVSDHGQNSVHKYLHADVLLRQAGLQATDCKTKTFSLADGGFALVYQQQATPASVIALKKLFEGKPGIRAALVPAEAAKDGWPTPEQSNQAANLLLYAQNDYSFRGDPAGVEFVTDGLESGNHGYPNTEPRMQAIFIAAGAGIRPVGEIPAFANVDVAATIAQLLHVQMPSIQGKPLIRILK